MRPSSPEKAAAKVAASRKLRAAANLESAWRQVRENAQRSSSPEIRDEANQFEKVASRKLKSIQDRLRDGRFEFKPARGIALKRKGKKPRPIVVAPIESRIVQRALLNVVQEIPAIKSELQAGFNFGGVPGPGFGVPAAVAKAITAMRSSGYYIRTDIKSFFVHAPRTTAVEGILQHVDDDEFANIFRAATTVELADVGRLGEDVKLFPTHETGVAQGSALSPLLCNYLLRDFDRQMNERGITCIRYIDDFILFAADKRKAFAAFASALRTLDAMDLHAYDPLKPEESDKADHGHTNSLLTFLGCELTTTRVRPTKDKRDSLLDRVAEIFDDCIGAIGDPRRAATSPDARSTFAGAICAASNVIRGWGNTYSFCSDDQLMRNIDIELNKLYDSLRTRFNAKVKAMNPEDRRRVTGLFLVDDCNKDDEPTSARTLARTATATGTFKTS